MGFKLAGHLRGLCWRANHIAARDIDLVSQRERNGLVGHGNRQIAIGADDARDRALLPTGQHTDARTRGDAAARNRACKASKIEIGAIDPLHGHAEGLLFQKLFVDADRFEMRHQHGACVPRRVGAAFDNVVASHAADGNDRDRLQADFFGKSQVFGLDGVENRLAVIDQIHFVNRQHHMADAQQRNDGGMAARLHQQAFAGIDQDDGQIGS